MTDMLAIGILLGASAGLTPGPLLTLVLSQTLKYGTREGLKVALVPLLTDLPIIVISLLMLTQLARFNLILGILSFIGSLFIGYLSYELFQTKPLQVEAKTGEARSLKKGALANALNPHPYLFWCSVGAPIMVKAQQENSLNAVAFLAGFYALLIGAKVLMALIASKSRTLLAGNVYLNTMRTLGVLLFFFALLLFRDGLRLTGIIE
jgi:threonine/homoserine/homoserine lactone efflux protein